MPHSSSATLYTTLPTSSLPQRTTRLVQVPSHSTWRTHPTRTKRYIAALLVDVRSTSSTEIPPIHVTQSPAIQQARFSRSQLPAQLLSTRHQSLLEMTSRKWTVTPFLGSRWGLSFRLTARISLPFAIHDRSR